MKIYVESFILCTYLIKSLCGIHMAICDNFVSFISKIEKMNKLRNHEIVTVRSVNMTQLSQFPGYYESFPGKNIEFVISNPQKPPRTHFWSKKLFLNGGVNK